MSDPFVVYRDDDLLVVHKPPRLATTAAQGPSLTSWAHALLGRAPHPTSRLDAEVTGLVTFALSKRAIDALRAAREAGHYGRGYLALATPSPRDPVGEWDLAIAIDTRDRKLRRALAAGDRGERMQSAKSRYAVRAIASGVAALWLTPLTGRTHQLRVHAASAGSPLLGDVHYGGPKRLTLGDGRVLAARRTMLHCAWLRIPDLQEGFRELSAPPPEDFSQLWLALGGDALALTPSP